MKLPAHRKALSLLGAVLPVMDERTQHSAAWIFILGFCGLFWTGVALLVAVALWP